MHPENTHDARNFFIFPFNYTRDNSNRGPIVDVDNGCFVRRLCGEENKTKIGARRIKIRRNDSLFVYSWPFRRVESIRAQIVSLSNLHYLPLSEVCVYERVCRAMIYDRALVCKSADYAERKPKFTNQYGKYHYSR